MKMMKKSILLMFLTIGFFSCDVSKQAQLLTALKNCQYRVSSISNAKVAGTNISGLLGQSDLNVASLPGLAMGFLSKNIPLNATLNLEITNPTATEAAISQFDYKILVNNTDLAEGTVNQSAVIAQGQKTIVPVSIRTNVYSLLTNQDILSDIMKAAKKNPKNNESLGLLTLKIRPTFMIGNTPFKYPGYITISKDISSNILF